MTIEQTNKIAKVAAVLAGLGLVAMSFSVLSSPVSQENPLPTPHNR